MNNYRDKLHLYFTDNTADFSFSFTHEDMLGTAQSTYKLGDYINFKMTFNTVDTDTKAVIQTCYATSDGTANKYNLISNRFVNIFAQI